MRIDDTNGQVIIGERCEIAQGVLLVGPLTIGDDVKIGHGCVIGTPGEHRTAKPATYQRIVIGARTVLREYVVVQRGVETEERAFGTSIGRDCYIMHGCHIGHDARVGDGVTLSPRVVLGGHTWVQHGATFGIGSSTHQKVTVGYGAMVGMQAACVRDVRPFDKVVGVPARSIGLNSPRMHFSPDDAKMLLSEYDAKASRP